MSDTVEDYLAFVQAFPALFVNPASNGIVILLDREEIREAETVVAQKLLTQGLPVQWAKVGIVFRDQYVMLVRDAVRFPDGRLGTYIRQVQTPVVAGVAIFPVWQGKILLLRHFRHATRQWHLEIPRGYGEPGSQAEASARRELVEELDATVARLLSLGDMTPNTGTTAEVDRLFYADVLSYGAPERAEGIAEVVPVSPAEFRDMVRTNVIIDSFTLAAYARVISAGLL